MTVMLDTAGGDLWVMGSDCDCFTLYKVYVSDETFVDRTDPLTRVFQVRFEVLISASS